MSEIQIDANKIIDKLANQIALLTKELAVSQTTNEILQDVNEKQKELIKAYEDKEKATEE